MLVRTPTDLGAVIREHRRQKNWTQQDLAQKVGVSRQWITDVEHGKPRAELALVLRALEVLSVALEIGQPAVTPGSVRSIDIDDVVSSATSAKKRST